MCQELCDKVTEHLSRATVQLIQKARWLGDNDKTDSWCQVSQIFCSATKVDDRLHRKGSDVQCKLAELDLADSVTVEELPEGGWRVQNKPWASRVKSGASGCAASEIKGLERLARTLCLRRAAPLQGQLCKGQLCKTGPVRLASCL